jgi:hypothetical protein
VLLYVSSSSVGRVLLRHHGYRRCAPVSPAAGAVPHMHGGARPWGLLRRVALIQWFALTCVSREKPGCTSHLLNHAVSVGFVP